MSFDFQNQSLKIMNSIKWKKYTYNRFHFFFQKKRVFVVCCGVMALATSSLSIFYHAQNHKIKVPDWLPLVAVMISMLARSIGILTTLHILTAEAFPTDIRYIL